MQNTASAVTTSTSTLSSISGGVQRESALAPGRALCNFLLVSVWKDFAMFFSWPRPNSDAHGLQINFRSDTSSFNGAKMMDSSMRAPSMPRKRPTALSSSSRNTSQILVMMSFSCSDSRSPSIMAGT